MGSVSRPFLPISKSVKLARSTQEFGAKNSAVTFLVVAFLPGLCPFSHTHLPASGRHPDRARHSLTVKAAFWFITNNAPVPRKECLFHHIT